MRRARLPKQAPGSGSAAGDWSPVDRGWYLVLDLWRGAGKLPEEVAALHAQHPGAIAIVDERGLCVYRNVYRPGDLGVLLDLWPLVRGWPGVALSLSGWPAEPADIDAFLERYVDHVISEGRPDGQCVEGVDFPRHLGCRDRCVVLRWTGEAEGAVGPYWFDFTRDVGRGEWMLDRHRLRHYLQPIRERGGCPALNMAAIDAALRIQPDRILVASGGIWRLVTYNSVERLEPRDAERYHADLAKRFRPHADWRQDTTKLRIGPED